VVGLDDAAFTALDGIDTWVVGCFLRRGPHKTHADLSQVLHWARHIGARRTVLTHMGTDMDWRWLAENLPAGVEAGHDGMRLELT
jgi:phosphoribosyl 1,2-cyclic phosphate phosphodiesterase